MSIVVAVRVGDGLVMAADSASTLAATDPTGKELGVAKVFNNATKLLQLRDYPIAVASWGAGTIGARTISSLVEEFANSRPSIGRGDLDPKKLSVEAEAEALQKSLLDFYKHTYPEPAKERCSRRAGGSAPRARPHGCVSHRSWYSVHLTVARCRLTPMKRLASRGDSSSGR